MPKARTNRLRVLRAERRMTQFALARKARINPTRLSFIENAHIDSTPTERTRLARALKVAEIDVFPWIEDATAPVHDGCRGDIA